MVQVSNRIVQASNPRESCFESGPRCGIKASFKNDNGESSFVNPTALDLFLRACFAGFALILLTVSLAAARRTKEPRLIMVASAFLAYTVIAFLVLLSSFLGWAEFEMSALLVLLQLVVLVLLYLAILKR